MTKTGIFNIEKKVILITGAFGLIGKRLVYAFLNEGAYVVAAGHKKEQIDQFKNELAVEFNTKSFLVCDIELTDTISINKCLEKAISKFGCIDVLVNNASIDSKFNIKSDVNIKKLRFENYPIDLIKNSVNVNLIGTIELTQKVCSQMMKQRKGNIINVGSIYSLIAPNQNLYKYEDQTMYKPADYVASKSFIPNFTRYLAAFYAGDNIRCNTVAPHGIYQNHDEKFITNFKKYSPIGRMCNLDEIEGAFIYLASEASSYMTGTTLVIDGGWSSI